MMAMVSFRFVEGIYYIDLSFISFICLTCKLCRSRETLALYGFVWLIRDNVCMCS